MGRWGGSYREIEDRGTFGRVAEVGRGVNAKEERAEKEEIIRDRLLP